MEVAIPWLLCHLHLLYHLDPIAHQTCCITLHVIYRRSLFIFLRRVLRLFSLFFFFFFQAEDGIRDKLVTGVQTCALPICGQQAIERASPPRERGEEALAVEDLDLSLEHVHGVLENRFEARGTALPHEGVGVLARRERGDAHAQPLA